VSALDNAKRGVLFSGPMVLALLRRQKTQTRRLVNPQPKHPSHYLQPMFGLSDWKNDAGKHEMIGTPGLWREVGPDYPDDVADDRRPAHAVGDVVYVREAWQLSRGHRAAGSSDVVSEQWTGDIPTKGHPDDGWALFKAVGDPGNHCVKTWRPGVHMPRWAARLFLTITDVRAQRLQDITEPDMVDEGVMLMPAVGASLRPTFAAFLDTLNGQGTWAANPWVWAYTFTVDGAKL
jgi:hypothetical protein